MNRGPFRSIIAELADAPPVKVGGREYSGAYLSTLVAVNIEDAASESARTPQLISELGRLTSIARRDKELLEANYRRWRAGYVHELTTDLDAATNAGLVSTYASGKSKLPSKDTVETYTRTLPEYMEFKTAIADAGDAFETLYAALDAARARERVIWGEYRSGGSAPSRRVHAYDSDGNTYDEDQVPLAELEEAVTQAPRTPIPVVTGPPPPPPSFPPVPPFSSPPSGDDPIPFCGEPAHERL
jgi:hypothetical protein